MRLAGAKAGVDIVLPIEVSYDANFNAKMIDSATVDYNRAEKVIQSPIGPAEHFAQHLQYRSSVAADMMDIEVCNEDRLGDFLVDAFSRDTYATSVSMDLTLETHLSELLIIRFTHLIGLKATASYIQLQMTEEVKRGIAGSIIGLLKRDYYLRELIFRQLYGLYPERFTVNFINSEEYTPIPFREGDTFAFYLTLPLDLSNVKLISAAIDGTEYYTGMGVRGLHIPDMAPICVILRLTLT
jgi:hypothetical protein